MKPPRTRDRQRFHRYAGRLLNPFRGVIKVLRYHHAGAATTDGLHRDIYVSME